MEESKAAREKIELESKRLALESLGGDRQAFNRLILMHQKVVFNICYRLLGSYDDADDASQEVFIRVHRYLKGFRFESSFRTWLYRITVNTCRSRMDSREYRMRTKKVRIDRIRDEGYDSKPVEIVDRAESPFGALRKKEIGRLIHEAIGALAGQQRLIVVLRDIEGRSYEEIVEITGLKIGTVKSRLSRARLKLREALQGKIEDEM